jgi:hypothetical protein
VDAAFADLIGGLDRVEAPPVAGEVPLPEAVAVDSASPPAAPNAAAGEIEDEAAAGAFAHLLARSAPAAGDQNRPEPVAPRVAAPIVWPTFFGDASDLIDRDDNAGLFTRLRFEKQAWLRAKGIVADRSLRSQAVAVPAPPVADWSPPSQGQSQDGSGGLWPAEPFGFGSGEPQPHPMSNGGLDLVGMRGRLIESDDSAPAIASELELAVAQGVSDPLTLRILGEAYLRMGRRDQAAAQFRQAMLARRRG